VILIVPFLVGVFSVASASNRELSLPMVAGCGAALLLLAAGLSAVIGKRTPDHGVATAGPAPPPGNALSASIAPRASVPRDAAAGTDMPVRAVAARAMLAAPTAPVLVGPIRPVVAHPTRVVSATARAVVPPARVMPHPVRIVSTPARVAAPPTRGDAPWQVDPALQTTLEPTLRTILGLGQALRDEKPGRLSAEQKAYVEDILTSGRRLLRLVNDASALARLQAGTRELHTDRVSPEALVRDVCDIVHPLAVRKRITIRSEIDPTLGEVKVDAAVKQLLFERVSSALQLSPACGHITIRVAPEASGTFRITVDPGRVDRGAAHDGLDAALERTLVESQGGRVGLEDDPARNPVFFAVLPRTI